VGQKVGPYVWRPTFSAYIFKTSKPFLWFFSTLQRCFILNTSVGSKFIIHQTKWKRKLINLILLQRMLKKVQYKMFSGTSLDKLSIKIDCSSRPYVRRRKDAVHNLLIALCLLKQTVLDVSAHQLQQHMIEICCKMIQLPYQWTRAENHSVSSTKWSFISALRWPALACVFDSVLALYLTHGNPLARPYGAFSVIFTSKLQFNYWFT